MHNFCSLEVFDKKKQLYSIGIDDLIKGKN